MPGWKRASRGFVWKLEIVKFQTAKPVETRQNLSRDGTAGDELGEAKNVWAPK
jgi:hypothetical protein